MHQRTFMAKDGELDKKWYVVDAEGQTLGRLATKVATLLRGKHKPAYTPHVDSGDYVIVVNAEKVQLTGKKLTDKIYYRHSQYPGGLKSITAGDFIAKNPRKVIELAVWGMLPKNHIGRKQIRKLKVYAGPDHPHEAQKPIALNVEGRSQ
ncbi:MAG TPA: 50S ribosomal protein L13 [Firmicutes bacterium]|nr:50S ribosomal protein L13 [Bacillota bacterium]